MDHRDWDHKRKNWGSRPWTIDFVPAKHELPRSVDFAVVGGGFTGLTAAARLKQLSPESKICLFEATEIGAGSSGHTGGMVLAESAAGDLLGLGDVLDGYQRILRELNVQGDLVLPGAYELARAAPLPGSPICWNDSGELRAVKQVPGGTINPGKVVSGLARAAEKLGVFLFERCEVERASFSEGIRLQTQRGIVDAQKVLFATNAYSLELNGLGGRAQPTFTLAVETKELPEATIRELGLWETKPFYTVDMPYLWGRTLENSVIFGSGLVHMDDWRELETLDVSEGEATTMLSRLEKRIRGLHSCLSKVSFTHRWGGPICIAEGWKPVFARHRDSENAIVLGAYSGHGVAQSVYLGSWAAEAILKRRELPNWGN